MGEPRIYCPTRGTLSVKGSLLIIRLDTDLEQDFLGRIRIYGDSLQKRSTVGKGVQRSTGKIACFPPIPILHTFDAAILSQKSPNRMLQEGFQVIYALLLKR